MKIRFTDQKDNFSKHLLLLKKSNVIPYDNNHTNHKVAKHIVPCTFSQFPFSSFFNYNIFPKSILTAHTQWAEQNRTMQSGDTIVQQINIPPFRSFSIKVIVGVRIKEVFDEDKRKGFSYETLLGHVETGISIFTIEEHEKQCMFTIETYSKPSMFLLKLFEPITSLYQDYCTKKALRNVQVLNK